MLESIWLLLCLPSWSLSVTYSRLAYLLAPEALPSYGAVPRQRLGTYGRTRSALEGRFIQNASSARGRSFSILLRHGRAREQRSVFALLLGQESFYEDSDNQAPDKMNRQHQ
jgi:hypothetical protein